MSITHKLDSGLSNLSREEVMDLIQSAPEQALKSGSILSSLASSEYNYIIDTFEKLTEGKDAVIKQIKDILSIPAQIKFRVYPHKNKQEVLSEKAIAGASLDVSDKKLSTWKEISDDPDFFVEVLADLNEESLIRYTISESDLTEVSAKANRSSKIITAILAGSLILGVSLKSNIIESLTKSVKNVVSADHVVIPERTFLASYPLLWKEISKLDDNAKYLSTLNALTNADIELLLKSKGFSQNTEEVATYEEKLQHIETEMSVYIKNNPDKLREYSQMIYDQADEIGIDYRLMTAIIRTESNFNPMAISSTGDVSLVQINPGIWTHQEWLRIRGFNEKEVKEIMKEVKKNPAYAKEIFDLDRLKVDKKYSLERFGEILSYLKQRYSKNDKYWYARYHSSTCLPGGSCPKMDYAKKVNGFYKEMNNHLEQEINLKVAAISKDLKELKNTPGINLAVVEIFENEINTLKKAKNYKKNQMVAKN